MYQNKIYATYIREREGGGEGEKGERDRKR
jgi:hypothetical protein